MKQSLLERARRLDAQSRSPYGRALIRAYKLRPLRPSIRRFLLASEGGICFSESMRDIYRDFYGVDLGRYSFCNGRDGAALIAPGTTIGNYTVFGATRAFRRNHPFDRASQHPVFYNHVLGLIDEDNIPGNRDNPLRVGHDVHVAKESWILPSCKEIGDGAVVEAGAVVSRDVPPYTIVSGNPAKIVRKRFSDEVEAQVRESRWFLRSLTELVENVDTLANPANEATIGQLARIGTGES